MIYNDKFLQIDGVTIPKIQEYKVSRSKLWKDAERNMNGDMRSTLVGIFPKIIVKIGVLTQDEIGTVCSLLDKPFFSVVYFDVRSQSVKSGKYYAGDYDVEILKKSDGLYKPFDVSLMPVSKRTY